jgi:hypothetical protein
MSWLSVKEKGGLEAKGLEGVVVMLSCCLSNQSSERRDLSVLETRGTTRTSR